MCKLDKIRSLKAEIYQIARRYNAEKLYLFGSCARGEETPESDVDFLADFNEHASLFDICGLKLDLETLLKCKVDVISRRAVRRGAFSININRDKVAI